MAQGDKLIKLYNLYYDQGLINDDLPLETWVGASQDQISQLLDLGKSEGLFTQDFSIDEFSGAWTEYREVTPPQVEKKNQLGTTELPSEDGLSEQSGDPSDPDGTFLTGAAGDFINATKDVPILGWMGEFVDDMSRAGYQGGMQAQLAGEAGDIFFNTDIANASDKDIQDLIDASKKLEEIGPSSAMMEYQKISEEGGGILDYIGAVWENPRIASEVMLSSIVGMMSKEALAGAGAAIGTGATYGAVTGAAAGGVGAAPGAAAGAIAAVPAAIAVASGITEGVLTFNDLLKEDLGENYDPEGIRNYLQDEENVNRLRARAGARGVAIGVIDALTAKMGGRVVDAIGTASRAARAGGKVASTATEAVGGSAGELAGQLAAGQEVDMGEIVLEGIAETPFGGVNAAVAAAKKPKIMVGGVRRTEEEFNNMLKYATPEELAAADIQISGANAKQYEKQLSQIQVDNAIRKEIQAANPDLSEDAVEQVLELEKQKRALQGKTTRSAQKKVIDLDNQIDEINQDPTNLIEREVEPVEISETATEEVTPTVEEVVEEDVVEEDATDLEARKEEIDKELTQLRSERPDAIREASKESVEKMESVFQDYETQIQELEDEKEMLERGEAPKRKQDRRKPGVDISEEAAPVVEEEAAPVVEEEATPVSEEVTEEAAPVAEEDAAPVAEEVAEETAPVAEETAPVAEEAAPVTEKDAPLYTKDEASSINKKLEERNAPFRVRDESLVGKAKGTLNGLYYNPQYVNDIISQVVKKFGVRSFAARWRKIDPLFTKEVVMFEKPPSVETFEELILDQILPSETLGRGGLQDVENGTQKFIEFAKNAGIELVSLELGDAAPVVEETAPVAEKKKSTKKGKEKKAEVTTEESPELAALQKKLTGIKKRRAINVRQKKGTKKIDNAIAKIESDIAELKGKPTVEAAPVAETKTEKPVADIASLKKTLKSMEKNRARFIKEGRDTKRLDGGIERTKAAIAELEKEPAQKTELVAEETAKAEKPKTKRKKAEKKVEKPVADIASLQKTLESMEKNRARFIEEGKNTDRLDAGIERTKAAIAELEKTGEPSTTIPPAKKTTTKKGRRTTQKRRQRKEKPGVAAEVSEIDTQIEEAKFEVAVIDEKASILKEAKDAMLKDDAAFDPQGMKRINSELKSLSDKVQEARAEVTRLEEKKKAEKTEQARAAVKEAKSKQKKGKPVGELPLISGKFVQQIEKIDGQIRELTLKLDSQKGTNDKFFNQGKSSNRLKRGIQNTELKLRALEEKRDKLILESRKERQQRRKQKVSTEERNDIQTFFDQMRSQIDEASRSAMPAAQQVIAKAVVQQARKARKAISRVLPDVKIVLHQTPQEYAAAINEDGVLAEAGTYVPEQRTIHINLRNAKLTTVAHEVFHAVLLDRISESDLNVTLREMMATIDKVANKNIKDKIKTFLEEGGYDTDTDYAASLDEEQMAELLGILASEYTNLSVEDKSIVRKFIEKLANLLGISVPVQLTESDKNIVRLMNDMADALSRGDIISDESLAQFGEKGKGVAGDTISIGLGESVTLPDGIAETGGTANIGRRKQNFVGIGGVQRMASVDDEAGRNMMTNYQIAKNMAKNPIAPYTAQEILNATGWQQLPNGQWRYGIDVYDINTDKLSDLLRRDALTEQFNGEVDLVALNDSLNSGVITFDEYTKRLEEAEKRAEQKFPNHKNEIKKIEKKLGKEGLRSPFTYLLGKDHPLIKAYPKLINTSLLARKKSDIEAGGHYNAGRDEIVIGTLEDYSFDSVDRLVSVVTHEIQHLIQYSEGLSFTDPTDLSYLSTELQQEFLNKIDESLEKDFNTNPSSIIPNGSYGIAQKIRNELDSSDFETLELFEEYLESLGTIQEYNLETDIAKYFEFSKELSIGNQDELFFFVQNALNKLNDNDLYLDLKEDPSIEQDEYLERLTELIKQSFDDSVRDFEQDVIDNKKIIDKYRSHIKRLQSTSDSVKKSMKLGQILRELAKIDKDRSAVDPRSIEGQMLKRSIKTAEKLRGINYLLSLQESESRATQERLSSRSNEKILIEDYFLSDRELFEDVRDVGGLDISLIDFYHSGSQRSASRSAQAAPSQRRKQKVATPSLQNDIQNAVDQLRAGGYNDFVIKDFLVRVQRMDADVVTKVMSGSIGNVPHAFANIEGGLQAGKELFERVHRFRTRLIRQEAKGDFQLTRKQFQELVADYSRRQRKKYDTVKQMEEKISEYRSKLEKKGKLGEKEINGKVGEFRKKLYAKRDAIRERVNQDILDYAANQERENNKKPLRPSPNDIMDQTLDFLEQQTEFKNEADTREVGSKKQGTQQTVARQGYSTNQIEMLTQLQQAYGINPTEAVSERLKYAREIERQRQRGAAKLKDVQKSLFRLIRTSLPKTAYSKQEVVTLMRKVGSINDRNADNVLREVSDMITKTNVGIVNSSINKMLEGKYSKVESGRRKAIKISADAKYVIDAINTLRGKIDEKSKVEDIEASIDGISKRISELAAKPTLTTEEVRDMAAAQLALMLNSSLLLDNTDQSKLINLADIHESLSQVIDLGHSELMAQIDADKARAREFFSAGIQEVLGKRIDGLNSVDPDVRKNAEKEASIEAASTQGTRDFKDKTRGVIKSFFRGAMRGINNFTIRHEALYGLVDRIITMPGDIIGGELQTRITDAVDAAGSKFKGNQLQNEAIMKAKLTELFGKSYKKKMRAARKNVTLQGVYNNKQVVDKARSEYNKKTNPTRMDKKKLNDDIASQTINLSPEQMYYLYNQYKDPANHPSFAKKYGSKENAANVMETIEKYLEQNEPKLKEFADWQVNEFFPSLYDRYNEVYRRLYKTNMPWNEFYAGRIYRENGDSNPIDLLATKPDAFRAAVGANSTKVRVQNANPIKDMYGTDVLASYLNDMEYFAAYAEPVNQISGFITHPTTKKAIIAKGGDEIYNSLNIAIKKIANRGTTGESRLSDKLLDTMNSVFIISRLALSPVIMLKQLTSTIAYADDIGIRNWLAQIANVSEFRKTMKEIKENSNYMTDRKNDSIFRAIDAYSSGKTGVAEFIPNQSKEFMINMAMWTTKFGDATAIYAGGAPNYLYYKKQFKKDNPTATEQEAIDYAIKNFERDTKRAQQSGDLADKDYYQTSSPLYRAMNMFLTTPRQYFRKEMFAVRNLYRKLRAFDSKAGTGTIGQNLRTFGMYHFALPVFFQYISMGLPGLLRDKRDEDDEDLMRAAVVGNLNALFLVGEAFSAFADLMTSKPYAAENTKTIGMLQSTMSAMQKYKRADRIKDPEKRAAAFRDFYLELASIGFPANTLARFHDNYGKILDGDTDDVGEDILRLMNYSEYQISGGKEEEVEYKSLEEINEEYRQKKRKERKKKKGGFETDGFRGKKKKKDGFDLGFD